MACDSAFFDEATFTVNDVTAEHLTAAPIDHLFEDGDEFRVGSIAGTIIGTPDHTPACITHVAGDAAFVGDTF